MGIRVGKMPGPTEERFLGMVLKLAKLTGWVSAHFRPGRTATGWKTAVAGEGKGFVDLILLRGSEMIVCELKVGRNKPSPEQVAWLDAFRAAGVETYLWYFTDWPELEARLMRGRT